MISIRGKALAYRGSIENIDTCGYHGVGRERGRDLAGVSVIEGANESSTQKHISQASDIVAHAFLAGTATHTAGTHDTA